MIPAARARAAAEVVDHEPPNPKIISPLFYPLDDALTDADLTIIVTAHPGIDHDHVARDARLLLDLRGVTRGTHTPKTCCGCKRSSYGRSTEQPTSGPGTDPHPATRGPLKGSVRLTVDENLARL